MVPEEYYGLLRAVIELRVRLAAAVEQAERLQGDVEALRSAIDKPVFRRGV